MRIGLLDREFLDGLVVLKLLDAKPNGLAGHENLFADVFP